MDIRVKISKASYNNKYFIKYLANKIIKTKEYAKKNLNDIAHVLTKGMIDYVTQENCAVKEVNQMTTYFPQYYVFPMYNIPVVIPDWSVVANVYTPGPVHVAPQVYTSICPYTNTILTEPVLNPVIPNATCLPDVTACSYEFEPEIHCINAIDYKNNQNESGFEMDVSEEFENYESQKYQTKDPIELFISLPKELFPSARSLNIDPNPVIDQFCQLPNINSALNWILDLEFGLPKVPVTRSIAVYNVKNNNIYCKNSSKVHPSFENCSAAFKDVILYYYKRIIYQWYKGYVIMNHDKSLENFQRWLLLPMQQFGIGWR